MKLKFYNNINKIDDAITRQQARIDKLVASGVDLQGNPIDESLKRNDATLNLTVSEHADFQSQQASATARGILNTDESLTIYNSLGEYHNTDNGGWQPGVNLATKVIVTQVISELLDKAISKRRNN